MCIRDRALRAEVLLDQDLEGSHHFLWVEVRDVQRQDGNNSLVESCLGSLLRGENVILFVVASYFLSAENIKDLGKLV